MINQTLPASGEFTSTARGEKSQAYTNICGLISSRGNTVLPTPQPTWGAKGAVEIRPAPGCRLSKCRAQLCGRRAALQLQYHIDYSLQSMLP